MPSVVQMRRNNYSLPRSAVAGSGIDRNRGTDVTHHVKLSFSIAGIWQPYPPETKVGLYQILKIPQLLCWVTE
jgi:hypothetical protein